ncbi:hypothetical protein C8J57DRAFT_1643379 [Mycena rebaudengoi]|nr:hypothetical protein C8J57DRAFT_1643379 [Mycena rebaudengoi]
MTTPRFKLRLVCRTSAAILLSRSAALQTFIDVADDTHHQANVKHLLELTGNLPLAVSLISSVASHEGCDKALSRWKSESTHMLSDGYDQRSKLDISIILSFTSSRMTAGAQDLLSLLSMLPDGLTDVELVQAKLAIPDVLGCKSILIRTSLAFVGKDQRLKVLVPIREHTLRMHPPRSSLKQPLQQHFHDLLDLWNQFQYLNPTNIAPQISHSLGNFDSVLRDALEHFPDSQNIQTKWCSALGIYFQWENSNMARALEYFHQALSLSDSTGNPSPIAERVLASISLIMFHTGSPLRALEYAKKDEEYAMHLGDIYEQAQSLYFQAKCYVIFANYQHAQILLQSASNLWVSCGLPHGGPHALMASLNIALIDIATGVDSKVILKNLEACRYHMKTFNTLSGFHQIVTSLLLDLITANLNLRDGNQVAANTMFSACLASPQIRIDMDIMFGCLEHLADLSTEMNNIQNTLRWAGIFLSLALTSKDRLAEMKALNCLGQISAAEGDDETALSLFTVTLDGFTFMDVHCWRAACMVRIADIYDKKGKPMKSVELWNTARPLFERSSQANSVTWIDVRLAEVASAVSERHKKQPQQLAKMNIPVGEPEEKKIVDIDTDSDGWQAAGHKQTKLLYAHSGRASHAPHSRLGNCQAARTNYITSFDMDKAEHGFFNLKVW